MGLKKELFDDKISFRSWMSWKEQLSFGGEKTGYGHDNLVTIKSSGNSGFKDNLFFIVAHEFGHLFDFINDFNSFENCVGEDDNITCYPSPKSWSALSWKDSKTALDDLSFPYIDGLCFYLCSDSYIPRENAGELYKGLWESNFISTYGASNPYDDFAESFAYFAWSISRSDEIMPIDLYISRL